MLPARVSLVTLGVADVERSATFYRTLGWEPAREMADFAVFRTAGPLLALYPLAALSRDIGDPEPAPADPPHPTRRTSLSINVASEAEVDEGIAQMLAAGAALLAAPEQAEWGGYSGYVADPDGHAWEIAYNPGWPLGEDGLPVIPE